MERDADKWFDSMISHSKGKTLGNTYMHSRLYRREDDFYNLGIDQKVLYSTEIDKLLELNDNLREQYKKVYQLRNREVLEFFSELNRDRLIHAKLEDKNKWKKLGDFFGFTVKEEFDVHYNKSNT
ncbi:hypothetical protein E1140_02255 [Fulvivirga lutimaris]|nr:hypothetical protein [Fulvivirga lutimaris]